MRRREATSLERTRQRVVSCHRPVISLAWRARFIPFHRRGANRRRPHARRHHASTPPTGFGGLGPGAFAGGFALPPRDRNRGRSSRSQPPFPPRPRALRTAPHDTSSSFGPEHTPAPGAWGETRFTCFRSRVSRPQPVPVCVRSVVWLRNSRRALSISNGLRNSHGS